ncbi:MAG: FprA family A-type flavoprotein [Candidatus Zixiibacteriota bacterium]
MSSVSIAEDVYWVGVNDPGLRLFDIIMPTEFGTTYNSYLIKGEKTALIDTVKKEFTDEFFANLAQVAAIESIDYLIVNHTEPDHAGAIAELLQRNPRVKIYCSGAAVPFVKATVNRTIQIEVVKDDQVLNLGGRKLLFKLMPYMHWPDTMMEYLPEDKILFSCDGFASHLAGESLHSDELTHNLGHEFHYYYDCIMRPFAGHIRRNLPKLDSLDIAMIAASHGPILRSNPRKWIDLYKEWTADRTAGAARVTVFYASNYGNTKEMADLLGDELTAQSFQVSLIDMVEIEEKLARDLIESSSAVVIGTPTFNGDAPKPVWDLVGLFATVYNVGKKAAVFGSYGWGGEGPKLVQDRLAGLKLRVYPEPYRARLIPSDEEMANLRGYANELARFFHG